MKYRHSHRLAVFYLIQNAAIARIVGYVGVDLHAAIDRPRMHYHNALFRRLHAPRGKSEKFRVFAHAREARLAVLPLKLNSKHDDDVGALDRLLYAFAYRAAERVAVAQHHRRAEEPHVYAELFHRPDVASSHARAKYIADDRDV